MQKKLAYAPYQVRGQVFFVYFLFLLSHKIALYHSHVDKYVSIFLLEGYKVNGVAFVIIDLYFRCPVVDSLHSDSLLAVAMVEGEPFQLSFFGKEETTFVIVGPNFT